MISYEEFKKLQEAGRILVLPCAIDKYLYSIVPYCILNVDNPNDCNGDCTDCWYQRFYVTSDRFRIMMYPPIDRMTYLTREGAEKEVNRLNQEREELIKNETEN